jgi:hypothetical protein
MPSGVKIRAADGEARAVVWQIADKFCAAHGPQLTTHLRGAHGTGERGRIS